MKILRRVTVIVAKAMKLFALVLLIKILGSAGAACLIANLAALRWRVVALCRRLMALTARRMPSVYEPATVGNAGNGDAADLDLSRWEEEGGAILGQ